MAYYNLINFPDGRHMGISVYKKYFGDNDGIEILLQMTVRCQVKQDNGNFNFAHIRDCKKEFGIKSVLSQKTNEIFQDEITTHYKNLILRYFIKDITDSYIFFDTFGVDSVSQCVNGTHYPVERYGNSSWTNKLYIGGDKEMKNEIQKILSLENSDFHKYNFSTLSKYELNEIIYYIENIIKE